MAFSPSGDLVVSSAGHYFRGPVFVPDRSGDRLITVAWVAGIVAFYGGLIALFLVFTRRPRALLARIVENPAVLSEVPLPQPRHRAARP